MKAARDRETPEAEQTMCASDRLLENSIHAATASIEIFNKPNFAYRHETFAILMSNAWELLLKAKAIRESGENVESVYDRQAKGGREQIKTNRSGNPITLGLVALLNKIAEMKGSGLEVVTRDNILALSEYRNDAVHLFFHGPEVRARVTRLGAASLRNYTFLVKRWFGRDLVREDYPVLPMTFVTTPTLPVTGAREENAQIRRLLDHWNALEQKHQREESKQAFSVTLELRHRKTRDPDGISYRLTNDPDAPAMQMQETDMSDTYPWTYRELTNVLKKRYSDFVEGQEYHTRRKALLSDTRYCWVRKLNPKNPRSAEQCFYSQRILREFDKHYRRKS